MTTQLPSPKNLSDAELIAAVKQLAARERGSTVELLRHLMEFDARRLYLGEGLPSLFVYCTKVLHYAEHPGRQGCFRFCWSTSRPARST
jgi:hypothetical protein